MKRIFLLVICIVFFCLSGCDAKKENSDTVFLFDTVVSITAECDEDTLEGAVNFLRSFDEKLSVSNENSEVFLLNNSEGYNKVSSDTIKIIKKALDYSEISGGMYDITVYPLSRLWDFNEKIIPSDAEIKNALSNVDYTAVEIDRNGVNLNGKKIDLGSVAKGYIADRLRDYFIENDVENALINLGGNIYVLGKEKTVGIKKPFSDELIGSIKVKNKSVVTAGVYERCFEKDGKLYHHILDTKTGYPKESDLLSATVINESSFEGDPLSTVCIPLGKERAAELVESMENTEAIFVDIKGEIYCTSGIAQKNNEFFVKN